MKRTSYEHLAHIYAVERGPEYSPPTVYRWRIMTHAWKDVAVSPQTFTTMAGAKRSLVAFLRSVRGIKKINVVGKPHRLLIVGNMVLR